MMPLNVQRDRLGFSPALKMKSCAIIDFGEVKRDEEEEDIGHSSRSSVSFSSLYQHPLPCVWYYTSPKHSTVVHLRRESQKCFSN